jgi:hypothetical protein
MPTLLDALPTPPTRSDPATFAARGDAFLGALPGFQAKLNIIAQEINTAAGTAANAIVAADAMEATLQTTKWAAGTNYLQGAKAWSPTDFLTYRRKVSGISNTDPKDDAAGWALVVDTRPMYRATSSGMAQSVILDGNSNNVLEYSPTVDGLSVTLQDATTLKVNPAGAQTIVNNGSFPLAIRDAGGFLIVCVKPGGFVVLGLTNITTAAGAWKVAAGSGYSYMLVKKVAKSMNVNGNLISTAGQRSIVKHSETLISIFSRNGTTSYVQAYDLATGTLGTRYTVSGLTNATNYSAAFAIDGNKGVFFIQVESGTSWIHACAYSINTATLVVTFGTPLASAGTAFWAANFYHGYVRNTYQDSWIQVASNVFAIGGITNTANPWQPAVMVFTVNTATLAITCPGPVNIGATITTTSIWVLRAQLRPNNRVAFFFSGNTSSEIFCRLCTIDPATGAVALVTSANSTVFQQFSSQIILQALMDIGNNVYMAVLMSNSTCYVIRITFTDTTVVWDNAYYTNASGWQNMFSTQYPYNQSNWFIAKHPTKANAITLFSYNATVTFNVLTSSSLTAQPSQVSVDFATRVPGGYGSGLYLPFSQGWVHAAGDSGYAFVPFYGSNDTGKNYCTPTIMVFAAEPTPGANPDLIGLVPISFGGQTSIDVAVIVKNGRAFISVMTPQYAEYITFDLRTRQVVGRESIDRDQASGTYLQTEMMNSGREMVRHGYAFMEHLEFAK